MSEVLAQLEKKGGEKNNAKYVSSDTSFGSNKIVYEGKNITLCGIKASDPSTEHVILIIKDNSTIVNKQAAVSYTINTTTKTITANNAYARNINRWSVSSDDNFEIIPI